MSTDEVPELKWEAAPKSNEHDEIQSLKEGESITFTMNITTPVRLDYGLKFKTEKYVNLIEITISYAAMHNPNITVYIGIDLIAT